MELICGYFMEVRIKLTAMKFMDKYILGKKCDHNEMERYISNVSFTHVFV